MDLYLTLKAGFMGFVLALGVQVLVFYLLGSVVGVHKRSFLYAFSLAAAASFVAVCVLLYYRAHDYRPAEAELFLAGCVGGWIGGVLSAFTNLRRLLAGFLK